MDGLAAARARGKRGGAQPKLTALQVKLARRMVDELDEYGQRVHTIADIARTLNVGRATIYRALGDRPGQQPAEGKAAA